MTLFGTSYPNSRDRCSFKTSTGMSADQMLRQGSRSCITPQTVFQLSWCLRKLLTNKFETAWAIEMTADREVWSELPMGATTVTHTRSRNISHQEVICSTMWMGWAYNQLIATRHSCEVKGCNTISIRGGWAQPLPMMAIQIVHKSERHAHSHFAWQPLMLVNSQKSSHLGQGCGKDWTLKGSYHVLPWQSAIFGVISCVIDSDIGYCCEHLKTKTIYNENWEF